MNKKLSRIAAIALSAAMVTSAFAMSTSASFAATTPLTITPDAVNYNAVYAGNTTSDKLTLASVFTGLTATIKADKDTKEAIPFTVNAGTYKVVSGNAKISTDGTELDLTGTGDVVVSATAKMTNSQTLETVKHNNTETYTASEQTFKATVHVYKNGLAMVLPTSVGTAAVGAPTATEVKNNEKIGINDTETFGIYTVAQAASATDAKATFALNDGTDPTKPAVTAANDLISSNDELVPLKDQTVTSNAVASKKQDALKYKTGYSIISAKDASKGVQPYTVTVADYYHAASALTPTVKTTLGVGTETLSDIDNFDITGKDVKADSTVTVNAKGANLGNVTATGAVAVTAGTVKDITTDAAVTVGTAANTGDAVVGNVSAKAGVTVTGASDVNSDSTFNTVTVGNITSAADAGTATDIVALKTTEDNTKKTIQGTVKVGNITTKNAVTVETTKDVTSLTTGTINGVQGNYADCPYTATFKLINGNFKTNGDLKYMGAVTVDTAAATATGEAKGAKLTTGAIDTGTYADASAAAGTYGYTVDANTAGTKLGSASTVAVTTSDASIAADSIKIQKAPVAGEKGSITVKSNSFTIMDGAGYTDAAPAASSGVTLYISDLTKGSVLYTGANHLEKVFNIPGVTTNKAYDAGKGVYNYKAEAVQFLGFTLNQTQMKLAKNESKTIVASPIPSGALETGVTIAWTANKDTVKLTPSADTLSCAVASTGYTDANVNDGNDVVITAVLMKDGAAYAPFNSDMSTGTCNITLTNDVTAPVLTTKVKNLNDTEAKAVTGDTVIKMTQSTYATVEFSADKAGIANINYITANDKVAQTGTASAWNGTAGEYTIYANGKVGDKVGVFANGVKVFQIEIVDRPFECDTTLDLDGVKAPALTVGQKYSFKIRKANPAIKDFTFLTANGSAVASWGFVKNADGTVTATIKALKATDKIGVYVKINNVTYKVFAAAVK